MMISFGFSFRSPAVAAERGKATLGGGCTLGPAGAVSDLGFNKLWMVWGGGHSPTADTAQSRPQRPIQVCLDLTVPIILSRLVLLLRRLRVPQVDVQTLDLFDQQENRLSGRAKLVIAVGKKTGAPGAELLDLALIQTIAQRSTRVWGSVRRLDQRGRLTLRVLEQSDRGAGLLQRHEVLADFPFELRFERV